MYSGQSLRIEPIDDGIYELVFDQVAASINTLHRQAVMELDEALGQLAEMDGVRGLLLSSAKAGFIVGADVTEFTLLLSLGEAELKREVQRTQQVFSALERLPFPTVALINGAALGGGLELALAADFRLMAEGAQIGLPEVRLGLCPAWGGSVRLSRLIHPDEALQWVLTGQLRKAADALAVGVVDRVVPAAKLHAEGLSILEGVISGTIPSQEPRQRKRRIKSIAASEHEFFEDQHRRLDTHYPAQAAIMALIRDHLSCPFDEALDAEAQTFVRLAYTDVASALVGLFMNNQLVQRKSRRWCQRAEPVRRSAVLGAGAMGSGIAFQSALTGTPVVLKDVSEEKLALGDKAVSSLLTRQVELGRMSRMAAGQVQAIITPTLAYDGFDKVDVVVETVVETTEIKAAVLAEVERMVAPDAVLVSNTSTISIDELAGHLSRPEQFCGMHFFSPVHRMPLVEVVRGRKTGDRALSRTMAYAVSLGKIPIIVNDGPGFLVNRMLFPYFNAFNQLLLDGGDFQHIDRVMEAFGWPMGPAQLADVVGIDTLVYADKALQTGFPERMKHSGDVITETLLAVGCLGRKSGSGFYEYGTDVYGKPFKRPAERARALISQRSQRSDIYADQDICDRLMIPMCLEAVRCLEGGIVETAAEVDMGLVLGLGFPRFRGGALRYIDTLGLETFAARVRAHQDRGPLYRLPQAYRTRMSQRRRFY